MSRLVLRRMVALVPVWLGISLFAFTLANLAPGDPAEIILSQRLGVPPTAELVAEFRDELGLDDPYPLQYGRWVAGVVRGNLGVSFRSGNPILPELLDGFGATLQLALPAVMVAVGIAVPVGVLSALRHNSLADHASRGLALTLASMPSYWLAYLLIIAFSVELAVLPVAGRGTWRHLVLPATTLGLAFTASLMRLTRSSLLDVLRQGYVTTARAMGYPERVVVGRHAMKNAMIPVVTLAGLLFGSFVTGTVIVETVFAWPGLGKYVVDSIFNRDYPVIQGFVVFTGTVFVLLNLVIDILTAWLDPRIRLTGRGPG